MYGLFMVAVELWMRDGLNVPDHTDDLEYPNACDCHDQYMSHDCLILPSLQDYRLVYYTDIYQTLVLIP